MTAAPMLEAALRYVEHGWPAFPVAERGKVPAIPGGRGCLDATTDLPTIERWWADRPEANIGLATGHAFDVLDLDGPDAESALNALMPLAERRR